MIVQFLWWGYHIIDLSKQNASQQEESRIILMIVSEGIVFLIVLILGIFKLHKSIKHELMLSINQNNFLLSVTHELKTPISSIKLYLQTLQKRNISEVKQADIIDKTLFQNEQLEHLINNILNATRLEYKKLSLHKEIMDVSAYLKSILNRYEKQYDHLQFKDEIQEKISYEVDPFIIETILNNLIENAIKYAEKGGEITIGLSLKNQLKIYVKDNGAGVPPEAQKNIFKKFYRHGNEDTRTQKGSGLGLFIVNEFSKLHHGQLKYYDNKPKGAVFELTL